LHYEKKECVFLMKIPVRRYFALLLTYLRPQRRLVGMMIICILARNAVQLLYPQLIAYFIDVITLHGSVGTLVEVGVVYILAALLNQGVSMVGMYCTQYVAWTATNQLRSDLLAHCLTLDMGFHKQHTSGEMIERIDGDIDTLSNFFSDFAINLGSNLVLLLGMLVVFCVMNWLVGLLTLIYTLLALLALTSLRKRTLPYWGQMRQASASYYGFLGERLDGLEDLLAHGAGGAVMRGFAQQLRTWLPIFTNAHRTGAEMSIFMMGLYASGTVLELGLGLVLWQMHLISLGSVYMMLAYANMLAQPLSMIQDEMTDLPQAEAGIKRVESLLHTSSALADTGTTSLPGEALGVEYVGVEFGYEPQEPIIRGISFRIEPGRALGLLGRTGSGKTTLARLLFRLYDPQVGEVRVQNVPLREVSLYELRRHIGMITQDVQIFRASVRDNLTFFERGIPDARILSILEELGLGAWYQTLPQGLDTLLGSSKGERGLSAGEAQLLACARVFLRDPGILILDEATSRLDTATEALLERAVTRLLAGRTALIIAHRLSTLRRVDELLLIEDGEVVERGFREELENDPDSRFAQLLRSESREVLS
jgi:ABC-type multidrug transport system fused ATPase/permease subunit